MIPVTCATCRERWTAENVGDAARQLAVHRNRRHNGHQVGDQLADLLYSAAVDGVVQAQRKAEPWTLSV